MKGADMAVAAFVLVMQVLEKETLDVLAVVDTILQVLTFALVLYLLDYVRERQARRDEERAEERHRREMEREEQRQRFRDPAYRAEFGRRASDTGGMPPLQLPPGREHQDAPDQPDTNPPP